MKRILVLGFVVLGALFGCSRAPATVDSREISEHVNGVKTYEVELSDGREIEVTKEGYDQATPGSTWTGQGAIETDND